MHHGSWDGCGISRHACGDADGKWRARVLNNRPRSIVARNVLRGQNYASLVRMARVFDHPVAAARRYLFGGGSFPTSIGIRTPLGLRHATLFSSHDAITAHEIFCRRDYRIEGEPSLIVDIGANIGLSALYFLTQVAGATCELYEPDPRNVPRLRANLKGLEGRYTLHESAVGTVAGAFPFAREPTGRYGTLDRTSWVFGPGNKPRGDAIATDVRDEITVQVLTISSVLQRALAHRTSIGLLKIDTEGTELEIIQAIPRDLLARVDQIVFEWFDRSVSVPGFDARFSCDTITLTRRGR